MMLAGCTPWPVEFEKRYIDAGYWGTETLGSLPERWAAAGHAHPAIVDSDQRIGYPELAERVGRMAGGLREFGVRAEDRVVVHLPNSADLILLILALCRLGAHPVLALPPHRKADLEHVIAVSEARAYITAGEVAGFDHRTLARELLGTVGLVAIAADDSMELPRLADLDGPRPQDAADPADVALFLLSGGTTGRPKLIARTHRDYIYNLRSSAANAELGPADVYLAALPIAHNYALACPGVLGTLDAGGTVVIPPTPSPEDAFESIARERVTVTGLVPPLAMVWAQAAATGELDSLRLVQVGGAKMTAEAAKIIGSALGCRLQQSFGMAEGLLSQSGPGDTAEQLLIAQGRPISPGDEVRVVDDADRDVPDGEIGRLLVRGPYTIRGYYRADAYNVTAFTADGYLRTGDLVRRLPSGHLVITGRADDVINRGGDKIAPDELEEQLLAHPGVLDAIVTGMTDASLGERVCAWVVAREPGLELRELTGFLVSRGVAGYKLPERLELLHAFPRTSVGKVDRHRLRKLADR
ncbi:(2,3-dihydroxybenzoyl)adenylate synthase [Nocardia fluminea]|uniref:(2,3-dihydroxybenzoyl)adenylate synthase n=1 Tax=Nocardia fluminea TaxID=134984 RepID=UPI00365BD9A5